MNGITIITQFLYTHFIEKERKGEEKRRKKSEKRRECSASSGKAHHSFEYTVERLIGSALLCIKQIYIQNVNFISQSYRYILHIFVLISKKK